MAGVPYHSAQQYIDVLIEQGYKVANAEQMEDPKQAVGVVERLFKSLHLGQSGR